MCVCISLSAWVSQDETQKLLVYKLFHLYGISHVVVPRYHKPQIFSPPPRVRVSVIFTGTIIQWHWKSRRLLKKGWTSNAVHIKVCRWFEICHFNPENSGRSYHTHSISSDWLKEVFPPSIAVGTGSRGHNWCISFPQERSYGREL